VWGAAVVVPRPSIMADLAVMFHIPMSRVYSVLDDRTPSSSTPQQQQQQRQQRYFDASSLNVGISHDGSSVAIASSTRAVLLHKPSGPLSSEPLVVPVNDQDFDAEYVAHTRALLVGLGVPSSHERLVLVLASHSERITALSFLGVAGVGLIRTSQCLVLGFSSGRVRIFTMARRSQPRTRVCALDCVVVVVRRHRHRLIVQGALRCRTGACSWSRCCTTAPW